MAPNGSRLNRRSFCAGLGATIGAWSFAGMPARAGPIVTGTVEPSPPARAYPDMIGDVRYMIARYEDTLLDIARDNGLGFVELVAANPGIDPWIPGAGQQITLPTAHLLPGGPRTGILLNLSDQRLYFFPKDGGAIQSYPIGTGQEAWDTPVGSTEIVRKKENPTWYVPQSIRKERPELPAAVRPGPGNPLGSHAMYLGWRAYLIHGTNNPWGVGRRVSHGCIRMYPEDIAKLFPRIPTGTPVTVVAQEAKTGWFGGELYLEVHPNPRQTDELEAEGRFTPSAVPELAYIVAQAAGKRIERVDWNQVRQTAAERSGLPVPILKPLSETSKETASRN